MKTAHHLTATTLAVLTGVMTGIASMPATAQTEPLKSREQVRQELMEAVRTGNIPAS